MSTSMLLALGVATTMLIAQVGPIAAAAAPKQAEVGQVPPEPTRAGKERLGGKASDEQRFDNCKVPQELRGAKPRPDDCEDADSKTPTR